MFNGTETELDEQFATRLSNCTELELVILSTIAIEHELNQFLMLIVPKVQHLKNVKLDFCGKVHLALSLGMTEDLQSPLKSIGNIRNDFAHNWAMKLDKSRVDSFVHNFTKEHQDHARKLYDKLKAASKLRPFKEPFHDLKLNDRFLLSAVVLRSAVRAVRKDVERLNPIVQDFLAINANGHRE